MFFCVDKPYLNAVEFLSLFGTGPCERVRIQLTRFPDDTESNLSTERIQPTLRCRWTRAGARDYWGNAGVGVFRESRERSLHASGLRRPHQLLHQEQSFAC